MGGMLPATRARDGALNNGSTVVVVNHVLYAFLAGR